MQTIILACIAGLRSHSMPLLRSLDFGGTWYYKHGAPSGAFLTRHRSTENRKDLKQQLGFVEG